MSGKRAATSELLCGNMLTITDPRTEQAETHENYFSSFHGYTLSDGTTFHQAPTLKDASLPSTSLHRDKFSIQHISPQVTYSQPYLNHGKYYLTYQPTLNYIGLRYWKLIFSHLTGNKIVQERAVCSRYKTAACW